MFRIESYITPIVLSYIDKYVKDFKPQDAQVSLWGGEVAFQNLDVRLDVLEEELHFPFSFVSGHIHELTVRVPWTKIASEPIQITINTIEFVLKLKTDGDTVPMAGRKKHSRSELVQEPPGYMASLVQKIANNISVKLNNIILKYVEEDIVVSMNIQLLTFDSADENWLPAFVDINPTKVILKKVINISDLTICLDKRNAMGKIDVCQEPILYRCSLQARLLRKYNISSVHRSSITRIDIFTESIELNVSAQQYPMLLRLMVLAISLRDGKINSTTNATTATPGTTSSNVLINDSAVGDDDDWDDNSGGSMITWAWNLLPTIFPIDDIDEDDQQRGHILHTGIYINSLKLTFKSQEISVDSIVHSTKKIKYYPILNIVLTGIYADAITQGIRWFNLRGGISSFTITPLEKCTCSRKHIHQSILTSADLLIDHREFLIDSLQDPNCPENCGQQRSYNYSWDTHIEENIEKDLLNRTPAIAFDIVHHVDIIDDDTKSSTISSDLEFSNLTENYLCRAFIGKFTFKYSSSLTHIIETLKEYAECYDYAPYVQERPSLTLAQLSPPSTEDYDALMTEIPMRIYQIIIRKPIVEIHVGDHDYLPATMTSIGINSTRKSLLPYISIEFDCISIDMTDPYYPNRLIHTTCQLPNPPSKLMDNCYAKLSYQCTGINMHLWCDTIKQNIAQIPKINFAMRMLIQSDLWQKHAVPNLAATIEIECLNAQLNKPQLDTIFTLHEIFSNSNNDIIRSFIDTTIMNDVKAENLPLIDINLEKVKCTSTTAGKTIGFVAAIGKLHIYSLNCDEKLIVLSSEINDDEQTFSLTAQFPIDFETIEHSPILSLTIAHLSANVDPKFCQFWNYRSRPRIKRHETIEENVPKSQKKSFISEHAPSQSKRSANRVESVHSSSDPTATMIMQLPAIKAKPKKIARRINFAQLQNILQCLVVYVDIKSFTIISSAQRFISTESSCSLLNLLKSPKSLKSDFVIIELPAIVITSSHVRNNPLDFERQFPFELNTSIWTRDKIGFPWNFALNNFSIRTRCNGIDFDVVSLISTQITLAVTSKSTETVNEVIATKCDHSVAIHIDTPPIQINLSQDQLNFIYVTILPLIDMFSANDKTTKPIPVEPFEIIERPSSPNNHSELKDFFGTIHTISENSSEDTLQEYDEKPSKFSIWIQWTLAKLTLKLLANTEIEQRKFIIEFEDIITSIDRQDIYMKLKTKITTLRAICKCRTNDIDEWEPNNVLGVTVRPEPMPTAVSGSTAKRAQLSHDNRQVDTFFDLTVTRAITRNVHNKWGKKRKRNQNLNDTITEIMINMQTIDVQLDLDILSMFMGIFSILSASDKCINDNDIHDVNVKNQRQSTTAAAVHSVSDLPLIFFQSKGVRVFLPILSSTTNACNVLIFKIDAISITPTVENPMNRIPVRGDIYTKAAQLRILNVPGSKIEDRQYEVMFVKISLGTGKWQEIQRCMDPYTNTDAYNDNPAFDWNNQTERPSVEINTIFKDFNLSITYAPCIIFKNVMVCGEGLEVNCLTDLVAELNTREVLLINTVFDEAQRAANYLHNCQIDAVKLLPSHHDIVPIQSNKPVKITTRTSYNAILAMNERIRNQQQPPPQQQQKSLSLKNVSENQWTDSGIDSSLDYGMKNRRQNKTTKVSKTMSNTSYPCDISFVGGIFSLKLYHHTIDKIVTADNQQKEKSQRLPLFEITLFQPNMFITQSVIDKTIQLSLFNFIFKFGNDVNNDTENIETEFSDTFFNTKPGDLDEYGVPPALFMYKEYITPAQEKNVDIHLRRPMQFTFSHKTFEKLLALSSIFNEFTTLHRNRTGVTNNSSIHRQNSITSSQAIPTSNKIHMIQQNLFNANRIEWSIADIELNCNQTMEYNLKLAIRQIESKLEIFDHPQKFTIKLSANDFTIQTEKLIILSPTSMSMAITLIQENWKRMPLIVCNLNFECVDLSISPQNITNILDVQKRFLKCWLNYQEQLKLMPLLNDDHATEQNTAEIGEKLISIENLTQIPTPKCSRTNVQSMDEFYQDDLRAGAFQFIEGGNNADDSLPLPYQIQIITRDGGTICWRYPQPRSLNYVKIFPVPFHASTVTEKIRCEMEYYSDAHRQFLSYCDFYLSEKEIIELKLPTRKVTAEIWRIRVHQPYILIDGNFFQDDSSSDEDDDGSSSTTHHHPNARTLHKTLQKMSGQMNATAIEDYLNNADTQIADGTLNIHPRALVGCMRIDSNFSTKLIPSIQAVFKMAHLTIGLKNIEQQMNVNGMPEPLKSYKLADGCAIDAQTFFKFSLNNVRAHGNLYQDQSITLHTEMCCSSSIVDYSYLTMQPLLDECNIQMYAEYGNKLSVNVVADDIRLRYGPLVGHSLAIAEQIWWRHFFDKQTQLSNDTVIASRFIICNATSAIIQFGQQGTLEAIYESVYLKPKECTFYAFRSDRCEQRLAFADENNWNASTNGNICSVAIGNDGTDVIRLIDDRLMLVRTEKLSATQKKVTVKGQIEVISMTEQPLRIYYKANDSAANVNKPVEFDVNNCGSVSVLTQCTDELTQCIKLRLTGKTRKGWSGEIPLHKTSKNVPWLVKVPTSDESLPFLSYWVRIHRENMTKLPATIPQNRYKYQRVLIVIWPLFMIRSMLAFTTKFTETNFANIQQTYELNGYGDCSELQICGTHETEHPIQINLNTTKLTNIIDCMLTYKGIDRNTLFDMPAINIDIDRMVDELEKPIQINWPTGTREEELRWQRQFYENEHIKPLFKYQPSRNMACSLMLDIIPTTLFINSTGLKVKLVCDTMCCSIPSNGITIPMPIQTSFTIGIKINANWSFTCPIHLQCNNQMRSIKLIQPYYELPINGSTVIKVLSNYAVSKFIVNTVMDNGVQQIYLSTYFVICNFTDHQINAWPFCLLKKDRRKLNERSFDNVDHSQLNDITIPVITKNDKNPKGVGINSFNNLSQLTQKDVTAITGAAPLLNYFLALQINNNEFSIPFLLTKPYSRSCFSIPCEPNHFIPLALSVICEPDGGQQFICLHNDPCPTIKFINRTDLNLWIAEAESCEIISGKMINAVRSIDDDNFEWYRSVSAHESVFYTPPSINEHFPDKVERDVGLLIAVDQRKDKSSPQASLSNKIEWSRPVKIYESAEIFLNLPKHGDIKISVNGQEKIIRIIIENINYKMEFNVKDIRTKLLNPIPTNYLIPVQNRDNVWSSNYNVENNDDCLNLEQSNDLIELCNESVNRKKPLTIELFVNTLNIILYQDDETRNSVKTELISLFIDDISVAFNEQARSLDIGFSAFQVDNQLYSSGNFDFPVVVCSQNSTNIAATNQHRQLPSPFNLTTYRLQHLLPLRAGSIQLQFYESTANFSINEIHCQLQPIAAYIEDKYINVMLDYMVENLRPNLIYHSEPKLERVQCDIGQVLIPKTILLKSASLAEPFRLGLVRIEPLSVLLSVHTCIRMYIALDHSPLDFGAFERRDIYSLPMRFGYHLGMHYVSGAIFGAGWVVGSLEILGSPSGLARSVSTGLKDFLSMPVQGLLRGPWGFLVGITQGSASLLKNITAGTVNSVTKLAASVARNLDRLSLDEEHLQRTEALRRSRPQGITHGFAQGLTGLGISILGAVGGLARHTLEARSSVDVFTGLGRGLVGAVTKPISGAAELVALTGQGMLHTVGFNTLPSARNPMMPRNISLGPSAAKIMWKYLPRVFLSDQILFMSLATLQMANGSLTSVTIALTSNVIVIVSMDRDELIEIICVDRALPEVDANDGTLVIINVTKIPDNNDRDNEVFQFRRVLQYIHDLGDHNIAKSKSNISSSTTAESSTAQPTKKLHSQLQQNSILNEMSICDHKISLFMDEHIARHFVMYVQLTKRVLSNK